MSTDWPKLKAQNLRREGAPMRGEKQHEMVNTYREHHSTVVREKGGETDKG